MPCHGADAAAAGRTTDRGGGAGNGDSARAGVTGIEAKIRALARDKATSALDTDVVRSRSRSAMSTKTVISSTSLTSRAEESRCEVYLIWILQHVLEKIVKMLVLGFHSA